MAAATGFCGHRRGQLAVQPLGAGGLCSPSASDIILGANTKYVDPSLLVGVHVHSLLTSPSCVAALLCPESLLLRVVLWFFAPSSSTATPEVLGELRRRKVCSAPAALPSMPSVRY